MGRRILVQTFTGRRNWPRAKERLSRLIGKVVVFYVKMADGFRKQFSASGFSYTMNVSYNVSYSRMKILSFLSEEDEA